METDERIRRPMTGGETAAYDVASETDDRPLVGRRFTTVGQDVWETVEWERRDAAAGDFFQADVEVPKTWSDQSIGVVAKLYFATVDGVREDSVRQMIHRVVHKITKEGIKQGHFGSISASFKIAERDLPIDITYFSPDDEARVFYEELVYVCLHQIAGFNTPTWLNVGVPGRKACAHACFPLSVKDTMLGEGGIVDWWRTESTIFKRGGGAGINLSSLRGSMEELSTGGTASGPVPYMRAANGNAETLRSGGAHRRAAKFVCLDVDHPDVLDFIDTKVREDRRMRILMEASEDLSIFTSEGERNVAEVTSFQSGNQSVCVTDDFMRAVEQDADWELTARVTGEIVATHKARDVLRSIAEAAWACGDPGVIFIDTINRFHTTPSLGPVTTVNTCLAGETLVDTSEGRIRIDDLQEMWATGQPLPYAFCFDQETSLPALRRIQRAVMTKMVTELVRVTTDRGVVFECTPDHEVLCRQHQASRDSYYVPAGELEPGQSLRKIGRNISHTRSGRRRITHRPTEASPNGCTWQAMFMWEQVYGPIPEEMEVHHVNEDPTDDRLSNLELIDSGTHQSFHSSGTRNNNAIDTEVVTLVEVYDYAMRRANRRTMIYVTRDTWAWAVEELGLVGRVSRGNSSGIRGMNWAEFSGWIERHRCLVNDEVASVERVVLDEPAPVYDITVEGTHNFGVCSDGAEHSIVVKNCGEIAQNDDAACNLAALNVLKFVRPSAPDDLCSVAVDDFKHVVDVMLVAQDIVNGFSELPTETITQNTRDLRQCGLGLTNLGAAIMARAMPYNSPEARSFASAVTALLTGRAYVQSARMAANLGAFRLFEDNREAMMRVVEKQAMAVVMADKTISSDPMRYLWASARREWIRAQALGAEHGWRNSQMTAMMPTGCLVPDTMVLSSEGLLPIGSLADAHGDRWQVLEGVQVAQEDSVADASEFFVNGIDDVFEVQTVRGHTLRGTWKHRIRVVDEYGNYAWRRMCDVQIEDQVVLRVGGHEDLLGNKEYRQTESFGELSESVAEAVGYFTGNGYVKKGGVHLSVPTASPDVIEHFQDWARGEGFSGTVTERDHGGACVKLNLYRSTLPEAFEADGFAKDRGTHGEGAASAEIPTVVLRSRTSVLCAYLRGLFEADGSASLSRSGSPYVTLSTVSEKLARQVFVALEALGVRCSIDVKIERSTAFGNRPLYVVRVASVRDVAIFSAKIGFISDRKSRKVADGLGVTNKTSRGDRIISQPVLDDLYEASKGLDSTVRQDISNRKILGSANLDWVRRLMKEHPSLVDTKIGRLLGLGDVQIMPVSQVREIGRMHTVDLSVPERNTYIAEGFVSHNTVSWLLGADTTGVEPAFSLVTEKQLAAAGKMRIVNQSARLAADRLGYDVDAIERMADGDFSDIRDEDLPVFATAVGENSIPPMGHIRMVEALQRFTTQAISKCITGDSLVATADGLVRIGELHRGEQADSFGDMVLDVASLDGRRPTDAFYYGGVQPVIDVELGSGQRITGTPNHRVMVSIEGGMDWRRLDEIVEGEQVAVQYGTDIWSSLNADLTDFVPSPSYGSQKAVRLPRVMDRDLALWLGMLAADGHVSLSNYTIHLTKGGRSVIDLFADLTTRIFDVEARVIDSDGRCPVADVSSKTICEFMGWIGALGLSPSKRMPKAVLMSTRECVISYMSGLALDSYLPSSTTQWALCLASNGLLDDVQAVLTNLGVVHNRIKKWSAKYDRFYEEVYATGEEAQKVASVLTFYEDHKKSRAAELRSSSSSPNYQSKIPGVVGRDLYDLLPGDLSMDRKYRRLADGRAKGVTRDAVEMVAEVVEVPEWIQMVLDQNLHFSPVISVEDAGEQEVYDVSVPVTHAFVANGIVNHNSVNMPNEVTADEIYDLYLEAWRRGIKTMSVYRDGSKATQVLSAAKPKEGAVEESIGVIEERVYGALGPKILSSSTADSNGTLDGVSPVTPPSWDAPVVDPRDDLEEALTDDLGGAVGRDVFGPKRRRLPRTRRGLTHKIHVRSSLGEHEGYIGTGVYEDGTLGEVFMEGFGRMGGFVQNVLSAWSTDFSIALQYGVPFDVLVRKHVGHSDETGGVVVPDASGAPLVVRSCSSLVDYIARWLVSEYGDVDLQEELGVMTDAVKARKTRRLDEVEPGTGTLIASSGLIPWASQSSVGMSDGVGVLPGDRVAQMLADSNGHARETIISPHACPHCSSPMQPSGTCLTCSTCGHQAGGC